MKTPRFWYNSLGWKSISLMPLEFLYRLLIVVRKLIYRFKLKKIWRYECPIIVVGNLTVGGTGKTPLVIALAQYLKQNGFHPGLVSRGYKGSHKIPQIVSPDSLFHEVGDEALLLVKKTNCPMVVAKNRPAAVEKLLMHFYCDVIICDDGLQHYSLARDIEIAVFDKQRGFGNQRCLPAGPLREPMSRLQSVDFLLETEHHWKFFYQLTDPTYFLPLEFLKGKTIHAVAGIGYPERFFQQLESLGAIVYRHAFPDHHCFQEHELQFSDEAMIVITEKDAVKCQHFQNEKIFCIATESIVPGDFKSAMLKKLEMVKRGPLYKD